MIANVIRGFLLISLISLDMSVQASGFTIAAVPNEVYLEGNRVFVTGDFINPDGCAISSVAVMTPNSTDELNRTLSVAMTSLASEKRMVMFFNGCVGVPWATSAPQAVSVRLIK